MPPLNHDSEPVPSGQLYPAVELRQGKFVEVKHAPGERPTLSKHKKAQLRKRRKRERQARKR